MSIEKKRELIKRKIIDEYNGNVHDSKCIKALKLIDLMYESNIPVGYWFVKMKEFNGSLKLKEIVEEYIKSISGAEIMGQNIKILPHRHNQ